MTRAVLFDLGNTLVDYYRAPDFAPILEESVRDMCEFVALRKSRVVDADDVLRCAVAMNAEDPTYRVRPLEGRLAALFEGLEASEVSELCEIFLAPIFRTAKLQPQALETLSSLRTLGIRTGIVSNTPWGSPAGAWREELGRYGLIDAVDAVVFCVDVGWRKPAGQVFRHALELLDVGSHETVFVGDDLRQDIAGAKRSGLRPVLFDPAGAADPRECEVIRRLEELLPLVSHP